MDSGAAAAQFTSPSAARITSETEAMTTAMAALAALAEITSSPTESTSAISR
ncbi:hypothetical protein MCEMAEM6B_01744 [Mycobacteriaceae bacterium]